MHLDQSSMNRFDFQLKCPSLEGIHPSQYIDQSFSIVPSQASIQFCFFCSCFCILKVNTLCWASQDYITLIIARVPICLLWGVELPQKTFCNQIYNVSKAANLVSLTRKAWDTVCKIIDHGVVVGRVIASKTKDLYSRCECFSLLSSR